MAKTMMGEAGEFVLPEGDPIHLAGEADAYAGESCENAYRRLFYVGCQCGFMVSRRGSEVRACGFLLTFDAAGLVSVTTETESPRTRWERDRTGGSGESMPRASGAATGRPERARVLNPAEDAAEDWGRPTPNHTPPSATQSRGKAPPRALTRRGGCVLGYAAGS